MLTADVVFSTEAIVVVTGLLAALAGTVSVLFKLLMDSKDEQLKSYREIAAEAVVNLEAAVNAKRAEGGHPPFPPVAPVVPEHNSPTTERQRATADVQTMRARLVAATLALGLPARRASKSEGG